MVIYLAPPTGSVSLTTIERLCMVRFEYLKYLTNVNSLEEFLEATSINFFVQNSDCLMEHNPSDKLSFFTLRLLSLQSPPLRTMVEAAERRLLHYRLRLMSLAELRYTLCRTSARADRLRGPLPPGDTRSLLDSLVSVTAAADRHLAEHGEETEGMAPSRSQLETCEEPVVRVPFALVAPLVASRSVTLSDGYALLLCRHTPAALSCLQEAALRVGQRQARPAVDGRLLPLLSRLTSRLGVVEGSGPAAPLSLSALEAATPLLPPCMLALRAELRHRHRLPHQDRVALSVFLKDVGLSLEDNVRFWEREYCQPAGHGATCSHSWSRCQKRYLYSLRHMYGLEGRRVAFESHSCRRLQERCGQSVSSCGGCPFVGFDAPSLTSLLTSEAGLEPAEVAALTTETGEEPTVRCRRYRSLLMRRMCGRGGAQGERMPRDDSVRRDGASAFPQTDNVRQDEASELPQVDGVRPYEASGLPLEDSVKRAEASGAEVGNLIASSDRGDICAKTGLRERIVDGAGCDSVPGSSRPPGTATLGNEEPTPFRKPSEFFCSLLSFRENQSTGVVIAGPKAENHHLK
ncbi:DNA primase large subunit-like isoform X1 [Amphibalanus amphitrite]|uniref:DNA primase large subunit-like isoform X1 n=2 Tax=Amphibalanus amphitrite TaxID=1232801 RepID=UPI001C91D881|nr:DNA primase large subunit-like isoform X1 [Amphibalanus amphitrite]